MLCYNLLQELEKHYVYFVQLLPGYIISEKFKNSKMIRQKIKVLFKYINLL